MIVRYDDGVNVENFNFPVLIIRGEDDYLYISQNAEDLKNMISYCTVYNIPKSGHSIIFESPKEIIQTINCFFKNNKFLSNKEIDSSLLNYQK